MARDVLVAEQIVAGRALVDLLLQEPEFRLEAAFWELNVEMSFWQTPICSWKFVIATPLVHEQGRIPTFNKVEDVIQRNNMADRFPNFIETADMLSPSEGVVFMLSLAETSGWLPLNQLIEQTSIGGVWIEGMYIYYSIPTPLWSPRKKSISSKISPS